MTILHFISFKFWALVTWSQDNEWMNVVSAEAFDQIVIFTSTNEGRYVIDVFVCSQNNFTDHIFRKF